MLSGCPPAPPILKQSILGAKDEESQSLPSAPTAVAALLPSSSSAGSFSVNNFTATVSRSEVPLFLHESDFFRSLESNHRMSDDVDDAEGEEWKVDIPSAYCKFDAQISSEADLVAFLSTLRYWQSDIVPYELFYVATTQPELLRGETVRAEFEKDFPFLQLLLKVAFEEHPTERLILAAGSGDVTLVETVLKSLESQQWEEALNCTRVCEAAARSGSITLLEHLMSNRNFRADRFTCEAAAASGSLACLKYAHKHGCDWGPRTCAAAALHGHLLCLEYAYENGCIWCEDTSCSAAQGGHLDCLRYADRNRCDWGANAVMMAIQYGHLHCLQFLFNDGYRAATRSRRYEETTSFCDLAAAYGQLVCLRYLLDCRCPSGASTAEKAAENGHLDCLKYLYETNSARPTGQALIIAAYYGHYECFEVIFEALPQPVDESDILNAVIYAAFNGHVRILEHLHSKRCFSRVTKEACSSAARNGHLDCLKFLHQHGCPWDATTCMEAAAGGHLACLKYAHEHGCPWDATTCRARHFGSRWSSLKPTQQHLACLEYFHQHRSVFLGSSCLCPDYLNPLANAFVSVKGYLQDVFRGEND